MIRTAAARLYVADATSSVVTGFTDTDTTQAPATPGSPYRAGTMPTSIAIDPYDNFVYVANRGSNDISAFALDATSGALTLVAGSPFAAGNEPALLAIDPTGKFAYVVNAGANTISAYQIDVTSGALTPLSGSPFATATMPVAIAVSD